MSETRKGESAMKVLFTVPVITPLAIVGTQQARATPQRTVTVKGEVIQVQQSIRTQSSGEIDQIRIRTRQGEEMSLRLGKRGSCNGCLQVGDRIRVRVRTKGPGQRGTVQKLRLQRGRSRYDILPRGNSGARRQQSPGDGPWSNPRQRSGAGGGLRRGGGG